MSGETIERLKDGRYVIRDNHGKYLMDDNKTSGEQWQGSKFKTAIEASTQVAINQATTVQGFVERIKTLSLAVESLKAELKAVSQERDSATHDCDSLAKEVQRLKRKLKAAATPKMVVARGPRFTLTDMAHD